MSNDMEDDDIQTKNMIRHVRKTLEKHLSPAEKHHAASIEKALSKENYFVDKLDQDVTPGFRISQ
jgi:hypothetical protein